MVEVTVPFKKIKIEGERDQIVKTVTQKTLTESELYIKLHLGVLSSLRAGRKSHEPPTAVNAQHLAALAPLVQAHAHKLLKRGIKLQNDEKLQVMPKFSSRMWAKEVDFRYGLRPIGTGAVPKGTGEPSEFIR